MGGLIAPPQGFGPTASVGQVASGIEITTTVQTTVLTYTPSANTSLVVRASLTIITASTTVTLSASWTDPNSGAQTYTWENATSVPVGVRLELPLTILAAAGQPVQVSVTAGTVNQVFVTGCIERLV
jgi:hypothetical protein